MNGNNYKHVLKEFVILDKKIFKKITKHFEGRTHIYQKLYG